MCRKCGEPDRRGSAESRRRRKQAILDRDGDGTTVPCTWKIHPKCLGDLTFATMQQDRIVRGGPYRLANIVAACGPCNRARTYDGTVEIPDGCLYGPVGNDPLE